EPVVPVGPAPAAGQEGEGAVPAIQEEGDFYIVNFSEDAQEGLTLDEFVKICQQATGLNFVVPQETTTLLQQKRVRMFGPKRIPKSEFYSFFQIILFINEFACVEVGPSPLSVIVIQSLSPVAGARSQVRQDAVYVLPEELDEYADQPATMITTVVTLPNTDVRQLANALRGMTQDQNTQNMLPAGASNSVILTGFGSSIVQLAKLLYLIDEESKLSDPEVPVFDQVRLEFAAAEDVKDYVEQLLEASAEALRNAQRAQSAAAGQPVPATTAEVPAKLIVDARTNSLLVMALPDDMPRIKEMIARLDTDVIEPEKNYHIYTLENVGAEDLAEVLETFLEDAQSVSQSGAGGGGRTGEGAAAAPSSAQEDVIVVAEPSTNSLLIAANKTAYSEVTELIRSLDRRANQVLIETALIELSSDDFTDIGVELGLAEIPGVGETAGFGITSFGLSTLEDLDNDGIADSRVPTFADGITAGILDGDDFSLPFLLRLLQTKSNVNVLSVPSILVNDNGSATVSTLDEVPFTQVTAFGGSGGGQTQENFEGYQEAGITLTISPSISASRYLRLGIELEVSNFEGSTSVVGSIPPPRVTRTLTTEVSVPDGDTMVIGGVITNNTTWQSDQIPWLGDLPLIGWLFGREQETEEKRTLYFFVTPHILSDRDFADLAEISYRKKLDASNVIGADRMRLVDPAFGVEAEEDPFASFEMPLYRVPPSGELPPEEIGIGPVEQAELLEGAREGGGGQP
ncbi:MAG TPA: secretin N-terminal domain-containing protein, partial [Planctomycetota bacterium]|nr:secretin N-terminal domain-containing protein [Planctomycetota bacterium]